MLPPTVGEKRPFGRSLLWRRIASRLQAFAPRDGFRLKRQNLNMKPFGVYLAANSEKPPKPAVQFEIAEF